MNIEVLKQKAQSDEGMTVEEIIAYEKAVKPVTQVYGKYGTLAKKYLEEHKYGKYLALAGDLPEYLHEVDRQAEAMYESMYAKLSALEEYKKTGDFVKDAQKENEIQSRIEEEILNEIVYVD